MEYVKVQINSESGSQTLYKLLPRKSDGFFYALKSFIEKDNPDLSTEEFLKKHRVYWIDEDAEQIDIVDEVNCSVFFSKSEKRKLYVEPIGEKTSSSGASAPLASAPQEPSAVTSESDVHEGVSCDGCEKLPIVGFRYKCVQCVDYDLCADCEAKKKHSEHVMFRFPTALQNIPFNRRFLKKMKKRGCFIHPSAEEGTPRHHLHAHKNIRKNIFSSLYKMMHDMAEGTEGPVPDDLDEKGGSDGKKEKEDRKTRRDSQKDIVTIPVDPMYLKAGVQVLNNFSEMFAKMINPVVVPDVNAPGGNGEKPPVNLETPGPSGDNTPVQPQEKNNKTPEESGNDKETLPTQESQPSIAEDAGAEISTTDAPSASKPAVGLMREYGGWTIINPPVNSPRRFSDASRASAGSNRSSSGKSKEATPPLNYKQISDNLYDYIVKQGNNMTDSESDDEEEPEGPEPVQVKQPEGPEPVQVKQPEEPEPVQVKQPEKPEPVEVKQPEVPEPVAPKQPEKVEWRAQIVYHKNHRINNAVEAMMAMGFSNESNWLTQLLESVDGDISQALDLMKPVK